MTAPHSPARYNSVLVQKRAPTCRTGGRTGPKSMIRRPSFFSPPRPYLGCVNMRVLGPGPPLVFFSQVSFFPQVSFFSFFVNMRFLGPGPLLFFSPPRPYLGCVNMRVLGPGPPLFFVFCFPPLPACSDPLGRALTERSKNIGPTSSTCRCAQP